jgi:hypothetical protein
MILVDDAVMYLLNARSHVFVIRFIVAELAHGTVIGVEAYDFLSWFVKCC